MSQDQIMADLDGLIKKAAEIDTGGLAKQASPGDPLTEDNGTSAPTTGAQMASNNEEAGKHTAAKVDGGAETNPAGASVTMSTEGATAVSTDGQSGQQGGDLEDKHKAANGDEGGLSGDPADLDKKTASENANLITSARAMAGELKTAAEKLPVDEAAAKATKKLASVLGKSEGQPGSASAELTDFDRMLAKRAQELAPEGAPPMAEPEAAGVGAEQILAGLESGEIGEEEAMAILEQAAQSGAISEEDLAEIAAMAEQGGGAPGGGGEMPPEAMGGGMPPEAMGGGAMPPPEMGAEDPMAMKVAMLDVGPDSPDYISKLDALHKNAQAFGYNLAIKTAQELAGEEEEEEPEGGEGEEIEREIAPGVELEIEGGEGGEGDEGKPANPPVSAEGAVEGDQGGMPGAPGLMAGGPGAEMGMPGGGGDMGAPMPNVVDAMSAPGDIAPTSPEEEQALAEVLAELGLDQPGAEQMMAAPVPQMDKVASYQSRVRGTLLAKAAALRTANQKKD